MFCQKCHIEYDESRKYCRNCGSLLSATDEPSSGDTGYPAPAERKRMVRLCPRCYLQFEVGNYCRICGSSLKKGDILPGVERTREERLVKSLSSEWSRLIKRKRELEICLENLEKQRNALPEEPLNLTLHSYQVQVESLSSRLREIEAKLGAIRICLSKKIGLLEKESSTIQKRLNEIDSLHQLGAITFADYSAEKKGIKQQVRSRTKCLKEGRQTISRLPVLLGGGSVSPMKTRNLNQFPSSAIIGGVLIIIALGAYFLWPKNGGIPHAQESNPIAQKEPSAKGRLPARSPKVREDEKIKSLLETIRRANLEKKIDLFMSCYAAGFKDKSEKKLAILENWNDFDYLDLSYDVKRLTVTARAAQVRVEWLINLSPKHGGPPEKTRSVLDVSLTKEDGHWKIEEIKPVS